MTLAIGHSLTRSFNTPPVPILAPRVRRRVELIKMNPASRSSRLRRREDSGKSAQPTTKLKWVPIRRIENQRVSQSGYFAD
jgi:hypothetical protein